MINLRKILEIIHLHGMAATYFCTCKRLNINCKLGAKDKHLILHVLAYGLG